MRLGYWLGFLPLFIGLGAQAHALGCRGFFKDPALEFSRFFSPGWKNFRELTPIEHQQFKQNIRAIAGSFFHTPEGRQELHKIEAEFVQLKDRYKKIVFVGRSALGIKAYLEGLWSQDRSAPKLVELPYTCREPNELSESQIAGLRIHLKRLGLSADEILKSKDSVLFVDFVYTGAGVNHLISTLHGPRVSEALKSQLGFFGLYPARMLVINNLMKINHASILEGSPIAITEERIAQEMSWRRLPNQYDMERFVQEVHALQISDSLYEYWGTKVSHPAESFTPEFWTRELLPSQSRPFRGHDADPAYLEVYEMMRLGTENAFH